MTERQAETLHEVAAIVNGEGLKAIDTLDSFIAKLNTAKSLANHMRWRIVGVTDKGQRKPPAPETIIDEATNAEGLKFGGIAEIFYPVAHAARYLKTNSAKIVEAIEAGTLYTISLNNIEYIPRRALDIFRNMVLQNDMKP